MSNKQESNIPWWAIVLGFIFFWPVGMILLFLNLGGVSIPMDWLSSGSQQSRRANGGYQYRPPTVGAQPSASGQASGAAPGPAQQAGQRPSQGAASGARPYTYSYGSNTAGQQSKRSQPKARFFRKPKSGKSLTAIGTIMSFVFGLGFVNEFIDALRYGLLSYADELFPIFGFFCASLVILWNGLSRTRLGRRQRLYMGVIGNRNSVFLSDLAGAAGVSEKRVMADLQRMLSDGILPMGYIDRASGRLVLTDQGYQAPTREEAPHREAEQPKTPPKEDEDDAILRQIKAVNDAIPDEVMTRKIDRIGEITGKILDYQRQNPAKAPELRQFLNYYLPTTLKILRAYAQMDAQGVEGENISAAKRRIEDMMDKVVEGFEKQLDQLFRSDVMDITTDVEVLERMLDKDGLGSGMTLGG